MRLVIQITEFLEILISCIRRLKLVWFQSVGELARTNSEKPRPSWVKKVRVVRLVEGMPNASSTGLKGEGS